MLQLNRLLAAALGFGGLASWTCWAGEYPPDVGTNRESAAYMDATENYLSAIDLSDEALVFERLGGTTATNWSLQRDGVKLADLKCTQGNTNHRGAVIAYRLGRELDFNIYPVAVYRQVDRRIGKRTITEQCALKEWASVLTQYYWSRDTFATTDSADKKKLVSALRCDSPKPQADESFTYYARSAYGNPKPAGAGRVRYMGNTTLRQAARDFSNMMVVDTLIGNEDRFPGGNLFFRSVSTSYTNSEDGIVFDDVRLYSLDNEAAFKGRSPGATHSARDLENFLWRFDAEMIAELRRLAEDSERLDRITDNDTRLADFIRAGIQIVLEQYAAAVASCGAAKAEF